MAKSKLVKANEKIAKKVTGGYKKSRKAWLAVIKSLKREQSAALQRYRILL